MPWTEEDARKFLKSRGVDPYAVPEPLPEPEPRSPGAEAGQGFIQGSILNPIEAGTQIFGGSLPSWAQRWRREVGSSDVGRVGELAGMATTGALGEFGATSIAPRFGGLAPLARTVFGAAEGALSRPSETPQEFSTQAGLGAAVGGIRGVGSMLSKAAETARLAARHEAARTAGEAGQAEAEAKLAALNLRRAGKSGRAAAEQQYVTATRMAAQAKYEAQLAAAAVKANPGLNDTDWSSIGKLPHNVKILVLTALSKTSGATLTPGSIGGGVGMAAAPRQ